MKIFILVYTGSKNISEADSLISGLKRTIAIREEKRMSALQLANDFFTKLKEDEELLNNSYDQLKEMSERLSLLYQEQGSLLKEEKGKNEQLLDRVTKLQDKNNHLQKSQSELTSYIDHISRENDKLSNEAQMLKLQMERKTTQLNKALEEQEEKFEELKEKLEEQVEKLEEQKEKLEEQEEKLEEQNRMLDREKDDKKRLEVELKQQKQEYDRELGRVATEKNQLEELARQFEQSWRISYKDISMTKEKLGEGGWGGVSVGVFREQKVAVKQMHNLIVSDTNLALMNREISTMSRLRHPNLLLFIGAALDHPSGNPLLVTEIMDTSLRNAYEKKQLTEDGAKLSVLRDTAAGLNYLHCHPDEIIHRDVSSANVLLESRGPNKWRAKVSDFGSANIARKSFTQAPGALVYSAPEILQNVRSKRKVQQTCKADVFSFGVLMCEVVACKFPDEFDDMVKGLSADSPITHMILECTQDNPARRPAMRDVLRQMLQFL